MGTTFSVLHVQPNAHAKSMRRTALRKPIDKLPPTVRHVVPRFQIDLAPRISFTNRRYGPSITKKETHFYMVVDSERSSYHKSVVEP